MGGIGIVVCEQYRLFPTFTEASVCCPEEGLFSGGCLRRTAVPSEHCRCEILHIID